MRDSDSVPNTPGSPPHAADSLDLPRDRSSEIWEFAELCLQCTAEAVRDARSVANASQLSRAIAIARDSHAAYKPADLLDVITRLQGHSEEEIGMHMVATANRISATLSPYVPLIPFASKLIAPSAFYESYDHLHRLARVLLAPVVYVEDTDSIGVASLNPVAAILLGEEIQTTVFKRFGIRPFITVARLDYEGWTFLCRKHFEL